MNHEPMFMTKYAVARLLKEFAQRLGIDPGMSDVMAQVHVQQSNIHTNWSRFIMNNCGRCLKQPMGCSYLNPTEEMCDTPVVNVMSAVARMIETGRLVECPSIEGVPDGTP